MKRVGLLGAGSWGTALAITLAKNGHDIVLWSALEAEVTLLQTHREHIERLPGTKLPENIVVTSDLEMACKDMDIIVFSVASPYVRSTAKQSASHIREGQIVVNVAKGIEDDSLKTLSEILKEELPQAEIAVLSDQAMRKKSARNSYYSCSRCREERDSNFYSGNIYVPDVSCLHKSGYYWN